MKKMVESDRYIRVDASAHYKWEPDLDEMVKQIVRHVDGCSPNNVEIVIERKPVCSFCGAKWTEDDAGYNGGCCDEDEENAPLTFTRE